ncbi:nidogen isoform X2 [Homalodisca vitripennis]|uniref:nidogen isoform X2 n=1 Tax=Homalodisca vitripennis TaxID=197043 RepID=UPI001EEAA84E|nr:nidogen isoform X2 [Homalodisca vitripennis]
MTALRVTLCVVLYAGAALALDFYAYGPAYDSQLPPQNDISSSEIPLAVPIKFFGETYNSIFVNSNGLLSFLTEIPMFFSIQFPLNYPIIAPLYANVDTSGHGHIYYRETQDPDLLKRFNHRVQHFYPNLQAPFTAKSLFIASWLEVGYFPSGTDKVNTFQAVIGSDGSESFVELLYRPGGVQWVQGRGSSDRLPDARAQAGFVAEDGRLYTLRGSGTDQIQNLDRWSNTDEPGVWLFRVGNTGSSGNVEPPQADNGESENLIDDSSCQTGAMSCHSKAQCIDQDEGYCCVCQAGYYGNGRTCLQDQIPLRVNGKVSVSLNGVTEQEVDVQAYIVTADGRCYTALSRVPPAAGTDAQLISSTADIIGWLFAKSINNAPNGYMLTGGVLNHTAFLTFNNGQHRTTVEQRFLGLDVFDQLRMEGRIFGTVPQVPHGSKLSLPDSQVQFRKISQGVVRSQSSYVVHVDNSLDEYPVTVEQTISFTEHCSTSTSESTFRLKSARTFISYEETENILRFASTNKVSSMTDNDDPCVVGQVSCVNNSHCIPEGSTFKCVCNNGFQTLYTDEATGDYGCVDINECQSGSHSCDNNALCINEVGSFSCQCRQGYTGNGYSCQEVPQDCSSISCSPGAECIESAENGPRCYCIPGFVGDGTTCTPNAEDDCLMCSPHAWCNRTTSGAVQCTCLDGYHGNGRECTQSEDTVIRTCLLGVCWCPSGFVENGQICVKDESASTSTPDTTVSSNSQENQETVSCNTINNCHPQAQCVFVEAQEAYECQCNAGFEGDGLQCSQIESCNIINNCHAQAQCIYVGARDAYECQCNAGFEGDGFNCFEIEMSCLDSDICHLYAECVVEEGSEKGICICDEGYQGDGMTCYRTDMCTEDIECGDNAACLWSDDTQRKECDCDPGYVMDYKICIKQGCEECHEDAECVTNPATGLPQCVCRSGLVGDGIEECVEQPLGCNVLANCAPEANCVYVSPDAGHRCQCRTGYEGNGFECIRVVNCLNDRSLCDPNAQCEVTAGSTYQCVCRTGFVGNGQSCREVRKTEGGYLLVNKGMATVRVPLEPTRTDPGRPIQLQYDQITIGLAVDCVEGLIYWSDITGQVIKSSSLSGKDITNFVEDDINSPEGLAVDWIGRKLFWTDSGKDVIRAADLDTGETETIVSSGLVNPRGIAVHPTRRKIYWSDWNRAAPKLESADLDGAARQLLVSRDVQLPNSLAIDWATDELCWTDAGTKKIECLGLESGIRRTVVSNCSYPFGLTITADKYYWTDWQTQKVESAFKYSSVASEALTVPLGGAGKLYGITAVSDSCPQV